MTCYIQLIVVSSSDDPSTSSSAKGGSYSLASVAAAMYLMISIAAADLGAGIALLSEARTGRWVQRKMFEFMLLLSFVLLAAASIMVLFKTSSEDVDLVVGAATVLFIADVDEKVMMVLKVIPSKWRFFWVLEVIGLSAALALLGLRATGHGGDVSESDDAVCTYDENTEEVADGCFIYSWYFILDYHPLSVTLVSPLVNAFVASPKDFMKKHAFGNCSRQDWLFALSLALWILEAWSYYFYFDDWLFGVRLVIVLIYVFCVIRWLLFMYKRSVCCRGSGESNIYMNFRWTSSTRFGLIYVPAGLFLVHIVMATLAVERGIVWSEIDILDPSWDPFFVPEAFYFALFEMWLVWCMCKEGSDSPERPLSPEAANTVVARERDSVTTAVVDEAEPVMIAGFEGHRFVRECHEEGGSSRLTKNLLLGWIQANALFALQYLLWDSISSYIESTGNRWPYLPLSATFTFAWTLVGVCAAASSTKGVAFWSVATYMLDLLVSFVWVWIQSDGSVKLDNF